MAKNRPTDLPGAEIAAECLLGPPGGQDVVLPRVEQLAPEGLLVVDRVHFVAARLLAQVDRAEHHLGEVLRVSAARMQVLQMGRAFYLRRKAKRMY